MEINTIDWIRLINSKGIGPKTFWSLLRSYKTASEALKQIKDPFPLKEAQKIAKAEKIILATDPLFPKSLRRSATCPPILFYRGDISILAKNKVAIVGARNASINGMNIAKTISSNLSKNFAIVSGLAKGIDSSAHIGSLENPDLKAAIAVLPFSIDQVYPKENQKLHESISKNGLLISEVSPNRPMDQGMFQARNRLIAMLSEGLVVIEAALKSGTMATAKLALDVGCEVMAVPGSPLDPRSLGGNHLIKNGAPLVENYMDVLNVLGFEEKHEQLSFNDSRIFKEYGENDKYNRILEHLSTEPIHIETLSVHTNIDIHELLCIISDLEISGSIKKYTTNEIALLKE